MNSNIGCLPPCISNFGRTKFSIFDNWDRDFVTISGQTYPGAEDTAASDKRASRFATQRKPSVHTLRLSSNLNNEVSAVIVLDYVR